MKKFILSVALVLFVCFSHAQTAGFKVFGEEITYETGTVVLSSINATLTALNLAGLTPKWQQQYTQGVAIATGAAQLGYGIWDARKEFTTLNLVNITAGTATIITNSILLYKTLTKGPVKKKNNGGGGGKGPASFNIYSAPIYSPYKTNSTEFGIRLSRSF
jgi:hypothetical protein